MNLDFWLLIGIGLVIALVFGYGGAILSEKFRTRILSKRANEYLQGKRDNIFIDKAFENERIKITKFGFKTHSGEVKSVDILPIAGNVAQNGYNQEKTTFQREFEY